MITQGQKFDNKPEITHQIAKEIEKYFIWYLIS